MALNRDVAADRELVVEWKDAAPKRVVFAETLTGTDLKAANTFDQPNRVVPQKLDPPAVAARMTFKLPPRSYTVVRVATA
jgi:alpha-N-arabinofuranosidase